MELFPELLQEGDVRSFQTRMSEVMVSKQQARVHVCSLSSIDDRFNNTHENMFS